MGRRTVFCFGLCGCRRYLDGWVFRDTKVVDQNCRACSNIEYVPLKARATSSSAPEPKTVEKVIVSVKGGGVGIKDIQELIAVVDREPAKIGVYISLEPHTEPIKK